ncbi:MAG TPA: YetF domain-containing protein [Nitrospiraceae bacterium]|nr:YetF domain-containing protein [Nitrospiraceae bacterium]
MDAVVRALFVYLFLLLMFRLAGRRTLSEMTSFDFVLLLIISEATQNAMIGNDYSITNGVLVIITLVGLDVLFTNWKHRSAFIERWLDGLPMILVDNGRPLEDLMDRARVDREDILAIARESQGLERMDQIKYAVLEVGGGISIVPKSQSSS